ncbi:MAG TPA: SH3 domain-containing protein [Thermoanaerobaculia bacterium]|nr:SH3 domain-containing protein [Thermoanaerobaculia bacterium]
MKQFLLAALLLAACRREPATRTAPPEPVEPPSTTRAVLPTIEGPKLAFVDEASADPALVAYRNELLAAVRRRDADAVVALADPNIRTSFGGSGGSDELRRMLGEPGMWDDLEQILTNGGTFLEGSDRTAFWAPYVYSAWPEEHDAFTRYAVIGDDVPLYDAPDGKPVATLSRNIVERASEPSGTWTRIRTADGRSGFVATKLLRSPVGYRAGFNKDGERWRMTGLVAGD